MSKIRNEIELFQNKKLIEALKIRFDLLDCDVFYNPWIGLWFVSGENKWIQSRTFVDLFRHLAFDHEPEGIDRALAFIEANDEYVPEVN